MSTIKITTCDIVGCEETGDVITHNLDVIFTTEQTEGRSSKPYIHNVKIDLCNICMQYILREGEYIQAHGSQGFNTYYFKDE